MEFSVHICEILFHYDTGSSMCSVNLSMSHKRWPFMALVTFYVIREDKNTTKHDNEMSSSGINKYVYEDVCVY